VRNVSLRSGMSFQRAMNSLTRSDFVLVEFSGLKPTRQDSVLPGDTRKMSCLCQKRDEKISLVNYED